MKKWTIEFGDRDAGEQALDVVDDQGRRCMGLTLGEVIEQIIFMHMEKRERYPMQTEQQQEVERARRAARSK